MSLFADAHGGLQHPAHDSPITVGGSTYYIRRSLDLARRIENAFGPLQDLVARLTSARVTADEMIRLYTLALDGDLGELQPTRSQIEQHIFEFGWQRPAAQFGDLVLALFVGNQRAREVLSGKPPEERPPSPTRAA